MTTLPRSYQLRVKGHFDQALVDWFAPFVLQNEPSGEATLTGPVRDQAELYGILLKLNTLNFPLLAVQPVWPEEEGTESIV
jgi:hypothetical protein